MPVAPELEDDGAVVDEDGGGSGGVGGVVLVVAEAVVAAAVAAAKVPAGKGKNHFDKKDCSLYGAEGDEFRGNSRKCENCNYLNRAKNFPSFNNFNRYFKIQIICSLCYLKMINILQVDAFNRKFKNAVAMKTSVTWWEHSDFVNYRTT